MNWENFYRNYRTPDYISGYQLLNKLGGGVFGFVYKARKESIGKNYAIKFLKVDDEVVKKAVLHELEAIKFFAQVDHPHLVSIEDKGEVDGIPFIIMGYAGERTLKKWLEEKKQTQFDSFQIFRQILSGVAALHEKSIIHFDLKPGNVFLKGDFARVGDYGLSRLMSESRKTLSFGRGTPYYMAPELLKKQGDNRSDIYSLGVILYECLTGEVPFHGDSEWEVLKKHEEEEVKFPAHVSEQARCIIRKMMAKRPEDRFQAVKDIIDQVDIVLSPDMAGASRSAGDGAAGGDTKRVPPPIGKKKKERSSWAGMGMAREDWNEVESALRDAGVEVKRVGSELKTAGVEMNKALRQAGRAGARVSLSMGDHIRNHILIPVYDGLDVAREKLLSVIVGNRASAKHARGLEKGLASNANVRQRPKRTVSLFVRSVFQTMQVLILALLVPIRFIGSALKEIVEFVLKLPFRVFGFLARAVLVFCGFSIIFLMIFALVYVVVNIPRFMMVRF